MMTDESSKAEQIAIATDFEHEIEGDREINCITWDTPSSILVRIRRPEAEFSDPKFDRIFFINPRPSGLQTLEESGVEIREMYVLAYVFGTLNKIAVKKITTWPTYMKTGEVQSVLNCSDGRAFLVTENGLVCLTDTSIDWDGNGKYKLQKDSSDTQMVFD